MLFKLFTVYVFIESLFCGCGPDVKQAGFVVRPKEYKIKQVGRMAKAEVPESSGLALSNDNNFWTHADSGNPPELYKINQTGKLLSTLKIQGAQNIDWEELAKDQAGNIYIGDIGNNQNMRQNLRIFRVQENTVNRVDTIRFRYADQQAFPPDKNNLNFDCEAFFYYRNNLYLFSKNRGRSKQVKLYKVPAQPGAHIAQLTDSIQINNMVTAADISPDGKRIALLGYGNIYVLETGEHDKFFAGEKYCLPFGRSGQAEALVFINNTDFIISNEGGKIFKAVKKVK
ncbi:hypothetical protein [Adhaeribacter rhizoryzae]|uniref:T9SS C-terminal target domain-containing protein n=1 Tax=Adhaeribacter rhizoryzae TaxID=2607907 RepID=A0A5M6DTB0_9BACT|nr:hypothetical protein [Adhaeribacter rhizoryzae]KAA5549499.1 hypothetical protein F0145_02625 [Adhaeribacter rhizoryzae]